VLLHIVARGKIGRSPEAELVERYLKRIQWPTKVTELPDKGGKVPELSPNSATIVLDERGEALSSPDLAAVDLALPVLLNELAATTTPHALVLDDSTL